ncbi:MAG: hypothetical protein U0V87_03560 [Acidobacteriota bacterium]
MSRRLVCILILAMAAAGSTFAAAPRNSESRVGAQVPLGFSDRWDGPISMAVDKEGVMWGVWSYRRGLETDIAVAKLVGRVWTTPMLITTPNGVADLDPRISFVGSVPFVTWWQDGPEKGDERVVFSILWKKAWIGPIQINAEGTPGSRPNIFSSDDDQVTVGWIDIDGVLHGNGVVIKPKDPQPEGGTIGPDPLPSIIVNDCPKGGGSGSGSGQSR